MIDFVGFPKMARLSRECIVTEKIDGTNGCIYIDDSGNFLVGSRTRWITPEDDNYGFAKWAHSNRDDLMTLGVGTHFGEWWGHGIQRNYGIKEKRFSLFNVSRWTDETKPSCCHVVPMLYRGNFDTFIIDRALWDLKNNGSHASPGFMAPEGIVVYHVAGRVGFKKTIENDDVPKGSIDSTKYVANVAIAEDLTMTNDTGGGGGVDE